MKKRLTAIAVLALLVLAPSDASRAADVANRTRPGAESLAGNSVDTATGAYTEHVSLVHLNGSRPLNLDLSYHSLLVRYPGDVGYGWTHQYEAQILGDPHGQVTVYLNRNLRNEYYFAGDGNPYTPLNESNRYDVLERTVANGVVIWSLRLLSGTTYIFTGTDQGTASVFNLASIFDRNFNAIEVTRENGKLVNVSEAGGRQLSFSYDPRGLLHTVFDGLYYRFLQYDANRRLSRIYDPVKQSLFGSLGKNTSAASIPYVTPVDYPITVVSSVTRPLILLRGSVTIAHPETLEVFLVSPAGTIAPVKITDGYFFTDAFLNENSLGVWKVRILNRSLGNPGQTGTINSFEILTPNLSPDWTQYDYDGFPFNHIIRSTDSQGQRFYSNAYDSLGRIVFQDDGRDSPGSGAWEFKYEAQSGGNLLTTVFDRTPLKHPTRFLHDAGFHLKSVEDALGHRTQYAYSPAGDRIGITDARGNVTSFSYDSRGNLTSQVAPGARTTTFAYDDRRNLTNVTDALMRTTTFTYDDRNNLTDAINADAATQTQVIDGTGKITGSINKDSKTVLYTYDATGKLATVAPIGKPEIHYTYDVTGRITSITDAVGNVNTIAYDHRGNIVQKRNAMGHVTSSQYDYRNRLVSETDERGGVSAYEYDANDNVTRVTNPLSEPMSFEYDAEDRLTTVTDAAGNRTTTVYDAVGRVIQMRNQYGPTASFAYDAVGNRTDEFGAEGELVSHITYNEMNLPVTSEDAYGGVESFTYNALGKQITGTNRRGKTNHLEYDKMDRVAKLTDPLGREFRNVFAPDDVLQKIVYADGQETTFTYTDSDQLKSITIPGGFTTRIEYEDDGKIAAYSPPNAAKRLEYTYDAAGRRVRRKTLSGGPPDTLYAYDAAGNVTNISTQAGSGPVVRKITRTYDALNRETSVTDAAGNRVQRRYNNAGLVSQIIYPDSKTVYYSYDAAKRLRTVTDWADRVTEYDYNSHDDIIGIHFPNGANRVITYDPSGRVLGRSDYDAQGAAIVSYQYLYDADGFVSTRRQPVEPATFTPANQTFAYDYRNRLTQAAGIVVEHDTDGNVTRGPISGVSANLSWDYFENLSGAGQTTFSYNAEDRLVGWQNGGETVTFTTFEDGGGANILTKQSSTGGLTRYVYGVGLVYDDTDGQISVHHYDERGNTAALSNTAGQVSGTITYSPYGEIIDTSGDTATIFKYGGLFGVVTAPNGLINMRYRWYSPEMKRFLSLDSRLGVITSPATLNGYVYAGSNPVNFSDPSGEWFGLDDAVAIGVGFVAGVAGEAIAAVVNGETPDWRNLLAAGVGGGLANWGTLYGPVGGVAMGTIGAGADYLIKTGLHGDKVDWGQLGKEAAIGGAAGGVGAGVGYLAGKYAARTATRTLQKAVLAQGRRGAVSGALVGGGARRGAVVGATKVGAGTSLTLKQALTRAERKVIAGDFIKLVGLESGARQFKHSEEYGQRYGAQWLGLGGPPRGNDEKRTADLDLPTAYVGKGGEYRHLGLFKHALNAACRPLPDTDSHLSPF